ncbi:myosin-10 [Anopheles darlingi]|uniref:myosin-10 n=1 Tax=Anopheles darlingi TaxID=43151 RepID=UPI0021003A85|nr:myosin-10 [Anopheles darlingi]
MANVEPCRTNSASGGVEQGGTTQGEGVKEVSLKRKKLPSVSDSAVSSAAPTDQPEQRSYASVVKDPEQEPATTTEPAPSSAALGNLAKANGKRLKLDIKSNMEQGTTNRSSDSQPGGLLHGEKVPIVRSKPPIPPKPAVPANRARKQQIVETQNAHTVQKLLAQNEQMRLELSELRSSLAAERNAVRSLRAQNESDLRKTKAECKKLQEALQHHKRNVATQQCQSEQRAAGASVPAKRAHRSAAEQQEWLPGCSADSRQHHQQHQQGLEVLKLNQENSALRETNKFLEEKYQISSEAERRKAADIRVQRDLYELRLTQLSKSAKNEIQRLLEELKSKERNIGQLKKELQQQQQQAASTPAVGAGGGCRKERKAAKNSAQQSHEMRKLRETETGSGTISKCNSNNSIQSVNDDYEQLEARESLELTIVTATTTTTATATKRELPAAEVVSTAIDRDYSETTYRKATRTADILGIENTTTYGNDVPEQAALPYELCKRTMEAHDDEGSSASSVETTKRQRHCVLVHQDALAYEEREAGGKGTLTINKATTPPIDCQQASLESEPDSALSSMSPQPNSFTGEAPENDPWNVQAPQQQQQQSCSRIQMATRDETKLARIKLELDEMQHRYESLNRDYTAAKDQIDQLEQELVKATQASREQTKLNERIEYLVQREEELLKESHELREQNELLEFRIIELEESHDKWSLRSPNSSPTVGGGGGSGGSVKTDGWTDTEKEHDHELIMLSERSDSGVTSPNSHHHLEDQQSGVPSPCDLSILDQIPTDDVRKRLIAMTKRTCYDEEDKLCMLQILSLLNNLEALSQDHEIAGDDMSLGHEMPVPKYNYTLPESSTPPKALLHHQPPPSSTPYKTGTGKIVATVQPFHSSDRLDRSTPGSETGDSPMVTTVSGPQPKSLSIASIAETFGGMKKTTRWNNSASLQESGVFVDEPSCTQSTQTELEDFPSGLEKTNAELCAEIEKLNRFREKIEECKGAGPGAPGGGGAQSSSVSSGAKAGPVALHLPAATGDEECDRRRLQYYVERSETLENKLKVYESSGEQQVRALADRLQRELQLEGWVKELSEKVNQLELENERLEEERCELEEVENDTRLRLQRLEEDLEVMGQRSVELEMSRSSYQSKYQDAKTTIVGLEELVQKYEEKVFLLEESENDLRERIELIYMFIPMLLLYNSWQIHEQFRQYQRQQQQRSEECTSPSRSTAIQCLPLERMEESYYESNVSSSTNGSNSPDDLQTRLSELMKREKELTQNIAELNRAYNETLENADNLWAQMEREYKEKIGRCEQEEQTLKAKIAQLEERLTKDSEYASERIAHLEETEHGLKARISRLSKENKELSAKHGGLLEEYGALKEDYAQLQNYLRGPAAEALEREKKRVLALEDELAHTMRTLRDGEESHRAEVGTLRGRLLAATKELNHIEVTNSELREEVETLEARIRELMTLRTRDDEKIKHLSEELESKQSQLLAIQHGSRHGPGPARSAAGRSLAQELERPLKGGSYARHNYDQQQSLTARRFPDSDGSGSEEKSKFPTTRPLSMAFETKEVKSLAETIILNAESSRAGAKTPKKSFVEEISN